MKIRVLSLRQSTVREVATLEKVYVNRLRNIAHIELIDVKPKSGQRTKASGIKIDGEKILDKIDSETVLVILDSEGKSFTSERLAGWLGEQIHRGERKIDFVVGSAEGLDENVKNRADLRLKLSDLTLPHQLVRLLLIEAIYRSFDILGPKTYHK